MNKAEEIIYSAIEFEIGHDRCYNVSKDVQKRIAREIYKDLKINKLLKQ